MEIIGFLSGHAYFDYVKLYNPLHKLDGRRLDRIDVHGRLSNQQEVENLIEYLEIAKYCFTK